MWSYEEGGVGALRAKKRAGRPKLPLGEMKKIPEILLKGAQAYGFTTDLWTTQRVAKVIEMEFGVKYHPDHVCRLLHKLGFSWQKPRKQALEKDEEKVWNWVTHSWPKIKKKQQQREQ